MPDRTLAVFYGTYDAKSDRYPFWWFMSAGETCLCAEGKWGERTRTMVWKSPPFLDKQTELRVTFPDKRTRKWTSVTRDVGGVRLRHEGIAVRRSIGDRVMDAVTAPEAASSSSLFDTGSAGRGDLGAYTADAGLAAPACKRCRTCPRIGCFSAASPSGSGLKRAKNRT